MADWRVKTTSSTAAAESPRCAQSAQDAKESAAISQARKLVGVVQKDTDLEPLRKKGFDTKNLTAVIALCDVTDKKFDERQQAMVAQLTQTAELNALFDEAVKEQVAFRETARTVFTDDGPLKVLKVSDAAPDGLENFLTDARCAYTTAKKEPYVTALAKNSYAAATLDEKLTPSERRQAWRPSRSPEAICGGWRAGSSARSPRDWPSWISNRATISNQQAQGNLFPCACCLLSAD